jgi:hypothetical protein
MLKQKKNIFIIELLLVRRDLSMSEYKIKFGKLKGLTPEEAFNQGEIEELTKLKASLVKNFGNPKHEKYKETNLQGYLAIEEVLLKNYQPLLKEFNKLFSKLSEEQQEEIYKSIDNNIFYNNDIIGLKNIIEKVKSMIQ